MARVQMRGVAGFLTIGVLGALLMAAPADATPLTLNFEGTVDLSGSGGLAHNPFRGFFTWDPLASPVDVEDAAAFYEVTASELIFNGVSYTLAGIFVVNDGQAFEPGVPVDGLFFFALLDELPNGDQILFGAALIGPSSMWNSMALPGDFSFLASLTMKLSFLSEEVPGGGDENDFLLGLGTLVVRAPAAPVPEPATLLLLGSGLAAAGLRRARQRR